MFLSVFLPSSPCSPLEHEDSFIDDEFDEVDNEPSVGTCTAVYEFECEFTCQRCFNLGLLDMRDFDKINNTSS